MQVVNVRVRHIRPAYRDLREWCSDPGNVYIGRSGAVFVDGRRYPEQASAFANPFAVRGATSRAEALRLYRDHITEKIRSGQVDIEVLRGKTLGCWCKPEPCHGDVLVELLARRAPAGTEMASDR